MARTASAQVDRIAARGSREPKVEGPVGAKFDVIVIGLGAVGSATAWQLARRGARVLGLDRFSPPHDRGSSHGHTRVTRLAVGEGPEYVPLVMRSHQIWREIQAATGQSLYVATGGVVMGPREGQVALHGQSDFVGRTIEIARQHGIAHDVLDPQQLRERFPAFLTRGDERCYFEHEAGFLRPEACVAAQLGLARQAGAQLRVDEPALQLTGAGSEVTVRTAGGSYVAAQAIVCAGAWLPRLMGPPFATMLKVQRQTLFWFEPEDESMYLPGSFPVFIWAHGSTATDLFYGFPIAPGQAGVKVATEQYDTESEPDRMERTVSAAEAAQLHARHVQGRLQGVTSRLLAAVACPYTVAPHARFVVTRAQTVPQAIVVSACSGHGFKHSAALGEALAQQALEGRSKIDLQPFGLASR